MQPTSNEGHLDLRNCLANILQSLVRALKDKRDLNRMVNGMSAYSLKTDELRFALTRIDFNVKSLARHFGLGVRTLERQFAKQYHTTPKAWMMRERIDFAPSLLGEGLSNKQIAASLKYTRESNFCRDFKRRFGSTPQKFLTEGDHLMASRFDIK